MLERLNSLAARHSFLKAYPIGRSVLGKELRMLEIGEGKTEIFISGAHHGNEWITALLLLRYAEEYSAAFAGKGMINGEEAEDLYRGSRLFLLPLVNPDGADIAMGTADDKYRNMMIAMAKTQPEQPFPSGWKANFNGTDLNLNYPAGWRRARMNKEKLGVLCAGPRDWAGEYALSEPESRALYCFTRSHDFSFVIAFHTQGEVIYWRYGSKDPVGARELAEKLSAASGYALEETPYASAFAGYKDWFIQAFDRPGFTVEAGYGHNPLPLADLEGIYKKSAPLITTALKAAGEL